MKPGRDVLDDQDRQRRRSRERAEQLEQRLRAARGRAHADRARDAGRAAGALATARRRQPRHVGGGSHARRSAAEGAGGTRAAAAPAGSSRSSVPFGMASRAPAASAAADACESAPTTAGEHDDRHRSEAHDALDGLEPDMPGSSMSIVTRSGESRASAASASSAVAQPPTTSMLAVVLEEALERGGVGPRVLADRRRAGASALRHAPDQAARPSRAARCWSNSSLTM